MEFQLTEVDAWVRAGGADKNVAHDGLDTARH
jgi:hypothetical protein